MTYAAAVLADTPFLYWRLGEASLSDPVADASGNGHSGIFRDDSFVGTNVPGTAGLLTGDADTAVEFKGTATQLCESSETFGPTTYSGGCAVELVLKIITPPPSFVVLGGLTDDTPVGTWLQMGGSFFAFQFEDVTPDQWDPGIYFFPNDGPFHVAGIWDGTNAKLRVNGVEIANAPADLPPFIAAGSHFRVGWDPNGDGVDVIIDEFAFYDYAPSDARFDAHYAQMLAPGSPPSVASLHPSIGSIAGGNDVRIDGAAFTGTTDVTFDGTPASFVVDNDNQVTAVAPAHAAGTGQVIVTTPQGSSA